MEIKNIHLAYFSATNTTKKIVKTIGKEFFDNFHEYNLTNGSISEVLTLEENDLLIVGAPVYAGRIPAIEAELLSKIKGNKTPAIPICVYGNRDYDDALLELKEILIQQNFIPVAAGAFIAQHSIFPKLAEGRPDEDDLQKIKAFANTTKALLLQISSVKKLTDLNVKGNKPYKTPGKVAVKPKVSKKRCDNCGVCAKLCPTHAINILNASETDKDKCISCGRCITVCHNKARSYKSLLYNIAQSRFLKNYGTRKEPELFFCE